MRYLTIKKVVKVAASEKKIEIFFVESKILTYLSYSSNISEGLLKRCILDKQLTQMAEKESSAGLEKSVVDDKPTSAECLACLVTLDAGCRQTYCKPCRKAWGNGKGKSRYEYTRATDECRFCGARYNHQVSELTRSGMQNALYHDADPCPGGCNWCKTYCSCA